MTSFIRNKLSLISNGVIGLSSKPVKMILYPYAAIVGLSFLKGSGSGWGQYNKWRLTRSTVTIDSELYDPIVNNIRDAGYWGLNVLEGGFGSAIIVATAPFSVPLLLKLKKTSEQINK